MMLWIVLVICLSLAFLLAGIESALLTVSRVRVRHAAEGGDRNAKKLHALLDRRHEVLHAVATANHVSALIGFAAVALALVRWMGDWGWVAAGVLALPVYLIGLELAPKLIFRRYPLRLLCRFVDWIRLLDFAARPWTILARKLSGSNLNLPSDEPDLDNFASLTDTLTRLQVLPEHSTRLLQHAVKFQQQQVSDVMKPLHSIAALPPDMPLGSARVLCREQKHSWGAVLAETGDLLGWLDVLSLPGKVAEDKQVRQYIRPLGYLHASDSALHALKFLRKRGEPIAGVVDERDRATGIVTLQGLQRALLTGDAPTARKTDKTQ